MADSIKKINNNEIEITRESKTRLTKEDVEQELERCRGDNIRSAEEIEKLQSYLDLLK